MPLKVSSNQRRPLLKKDIIWAQSQTKSHAQAATLLNTAFTTYKKYAQMYQLYDTEFKNERGAGISKIRKRGAYGLYDILAGKHPHYDRTVLKERLIEAGMVPHHCRYCGYNKTRPDNRGPFVLDYIDGDRMNLSQDNLALTCYNCYYNTTGRLRTALLVPDSDVTHVLPEERTRDMLDVAGLTYDDIRDIHESTMLLTDDDDE